MMLCGQRPAWQPVLVALLLTAWAYASGPSVSVTLDGPSEGWHTEDLTFTAGGDYSLDGETQQEVQDGEAGVSEAYAWSYAPAQLIAGGGTQDNYVTVRYAENQAKQTHPISVTYTVTVTYADGSSDSGSASASKDVYIKGSTVQSSSADDTEIMSGAIQDANHQCEVEAHVQPAKAGITVNFTVLDQSPSTTAAQVSPQSAMTDPAGIARTILTSSNTPDEGYAVTVTAKCQGEDGAGKSVQVTLLLPDNEFGEPEE